MEAEVAAKVALISGSQTGLAWLAARPALAGLLVLEDRSQLHTPNFERYIWE
jgi:thiamine biosynthesis lipoprotein